MSDPIAELAEARIREAMERGDFNDLPGAGRPQVLDDDRMVPEHLRMAYRVLRNANCLPPELIARREVARIEDLIAAATRDGDTVARRHAERRLIALRVQLERHRAPGAFRIDDAAYRERLTARLDRETASDEP